MAQHADCCCLTCPVAFYICFVQVAFADKILLNKIDLVSEAEKKEVIRRIKVSAKAEAHTGRALLAAVCKQSVFES
jgi:G3E family GTPase